jgi:crotonobetainyl-CoA:carnitine CoA-transferase CaiB-like acyl-CoA transferase
MPGPLNGIRVLDFTIAQQGAYATLLLSDMGAEVIKVEQPGRGEVGRMLGMDRNTGFSCYFLAINRGKKGLAVDITKPVGRDLVLRLARECDIVAHNFRPGVIEKLGLGYEAFKAEKPDVIYACASAFGSMGPLGRKPGNDILAQAMSGIMSVTGEAGAPNPMGAAIADHVGALTFTVGIMAALFHRQRTGQGQRVETSLLGSMMAAQSWELTHYMMTGELPGKAGRGHTHLPWLWYTYRTADGWLVLGGVTPDRLPGFWEAIELDIMSSDERFDSIGKLIRNRDDLNKLLDEHFSHKPTEHWLPRLESADIFCAPVLNYEQLTRHKQVALNGYTLKTDHRKAGPARVVPTPIAFSETPVDSTRPEPALGEHTEEILRGLGCADTDLGEMRAVNVI